VQLQVSRATRRSRVDLDVIRAWWSLRSLLAVRWMVEHGSKTVLARLRDRRAEIPAVRLREPRG